MGLQSCLLLALIVAVSALAQARDAPPPEQMTDSVDSAFKQAEGSSVSRKLRVEGVIGRFRDRGALAVPLYGRPDPSRVDRLFADGQFQWKPDAQWTLKLSGRLGERRTAGAAQPGSAHGFMSLREGMAGLRIGDATFLEAGRIVERNGAAFGGNPTDYLRGFSVVDTVAWDPRESRENRLGVALLRVSRIEEGYGWNLDFAPRLTSHMPAVNPAPGMRAHWEQTNWQQRILGKLTLNLSDELSPELLAYHDWFGSSLGLNLATGVGNATTAYVESSVSNRLPLTAEASRFALQAGVFAAQSPPVSCRA